MEGTGEQSIDSVERKKPAHTQNNRNTLEQVDRQADGTRSSWSGAQELLRKRANNTQCVKLLPKVILFDEVREKIT